MTVKKAIPRKTVAPRATTVTERIATLESQVTELTGHVELLAKS